MDLLIVMILLFGLCMGFAAGIKTQKITSGILLSTIALFIGGLMGLSAYFLAYMFGALLGNTGAE
jgi:hypothetical protein